KLASHGHNGIARAVRPAHSVFDGDTIFAMCSGEIDTTLDAVGILASRAVEQAIVDAVTHAQTVGKFISLGDFRQGKTK
ncbi:MAG: P1 family peptidase, partial [Treponema sp.]|nr:P1 family peptidase [Treponema sp.]